MSTPENFQLPADFVLLMTEAQSRLFGFLLKRLGDREQALDVLQEVNLVLCRKAAAFVPGTSFIAWAFTVARFQVLAFRQGQARDRLVFPENLAEQLDQLDAEMFPAEAADARQTALDHCLAKLPPVQHELVLKRYAESVSVKSIAAEMGRTVNAVSMILHRVREQLLHCVEAELARGDGAP